MSGADITALIALILLGLIGFKSGLLRRVFVWGGGLAGYIVAPFLVPTVLEKYANTENSIGKDLGLENLVIPSLTMGFCIIAGMLLGGLLGSLAIKVFKIVPLPLVFADRIAGMIFGLVMGVAILWMVFGFMESLGGDAARIEADSKISDGINIILPDAPIGRVSEIYEKARGTADQGIAATRSLQTLSSVTQ